jgi:hypothetical protein
MAVGFPTKVDYATGDVLTATNMNDLSGTVNTLQSAFESAAGVNKILNSDFGIWQRGTSFTNPAVNAYTADRWLVAKDGSGSTVTVSQQTFTPGAAPVAGYEGQFFFRYAQSVAGTGATYNIISQRIEDVRTLAGQTVTVSFWAKAASAFNTLVIDLTQNFGSGGSGDVNTQLSSSIALTTSWTRYSFTVAVPSITGKTIGTTSFLGFRIFLPNNAVQTLDLWGVQVEASSTASDFKTATGTKQGELAACQRYYFRYTETSASSDWMIGFGSGTTATAALGQVKHPVTMRVYPSAVDFSGLCIFDGVNSRIAVTNLTLSERSKDVTNVAITVASGVTAYRPYFLAQNSNATGYLGLSAEL